MAMIDIKTYITRYYDPECAPSIRQVRYWIGLGKLPGEKRGRNYYIDTDRITPATGNKIVDTVLHHTPRRKRA
jgi:hypothetical protein